MGALCSSVCQTTTRPIMPAPSPPSLPPLRSLNFSLPAEIELSGWVAMMANLRWLSVRANRIIVTDDLGRLSRLQYLHLATTPVDVPLVDSMTFSQHCIPGARRGHARPAVPCQHCLHGLWVPALGGRREIFGY